MSDIPRVSDSEWEIMKVLWAAVKPLSANEVVEALKDRSDWSPKTVRTLITRLVRKKAVGIHQISSRSYTYYPLLAEEEGIRTETESFLKRISKNALKPLLVQFLNEQPLSEQDIEELKSLLDKRRG